MSTKARAGLRACRQAVTRRSSWLAPLAFLGGRDLIWWAKLCASKTFYCRFCQQFTRNNQSIYSLHLFLLTKTLITNSWCNIFQLIHKCSSYISFRHWWSPRIRASQRRARLMGSSKVTERKRRMKAGRCSATSMRSPMLLSKTRQQSPSTDRTTRGWWA